MKKKGFFAFIITVLLTAVMTVTVFAAEDYSVLGLYTSQGYENEYFNIKVDLPSDFTLSGRGLISLVGDDVVEASNKETTLSSLMSLLNLSSATVFNADTGYDYITILVQSPGIMKDVWDEEKNIAENSTAGVEEDLRNLAEDGLTISDIETKVDYLDNFAGKKHYVILYKYTANDTPIYGVNILVRSGDKKYLLMVNIESLVADNVETIAGYFTKLK